MPTLLLALYDSNNLSYIPTYLIFKVYEFFVQSLRVYVMYVSISFPEEYTQYYFENSNSKMRIHVN